MAKFVKVAKTSEIEEQSARCIEIEESASLCSISVENSMLSMIPVLTGVARSAKVPLKARKSNALGIGRTSTSNQAQ